MKCLSMDTKTGKPCKRTVAARGCPHHGIDHIQQRLRMAVKPYVAEEYQPTLVPRLTRDQILDLVRKGYEEEARRAAPSAPCGCQG